MTENNVFLPAEEIAAKLSTGLVQLHEPGLKNVQGKLCELTRKQEVVYSQLHDENMRLAEVFYDHDSVEMFRKAKVAREKLLQIKRKMTMLREKSAKLKKAALKLEETKHKEALDRVLEREREERLIGDTPRASTS